MLRRAVINHLLAQRSDLRAELRRHAGRTAKLQLPPRSLQFSIGENGLLQPASSKVPDVTLHIPVALLPRLLLRDPTAERELQIDGDSQLAATLGRVLQALDWDVEADLARLLGDIPAHRLAGTARRWLGDPRQFLRNLAETATEYAQDEAHLLVARPSLNQFVNEVDRLRDDVARLEKRLARQLATGNGSSAGAP
ncbi:ubiquinone biosynthesis accessory factor UbiJ [Chitinimonas sp.]|uniref:ubiquinone biosynthesis accessory factor UbiJ n=1 Tax=Chitinimonas sp. TaxID=1934313 RepID=UPI002F926159